MKDRIITLLVALSFFIFTPGLGAERSLGLPGPSIPEDNPVTPEKVALGKKLYFDKRLSFDNRISCATCHDPQKGFSDGLPAPLGIKGCRNTPPTLNAALCEPLFWDGRAPTLEELIKWPIIHPLELGMHSHQALVDKLQGIEEYRQDFRRVFGNEITIEEVVKAIATFVRSLLLGNSPFDRFLYGAEEGALSPEAKAGLELFRGKGNCVTCHSFNERFALFTDNSFHNLGVGMDKVEPDLGRYNVNKIPGDKGAFKTPSLRNVALTAPYMHDGSKPTLEAVVEFLNKGGMANPYLSPEIRPLNLTEEEKSNLVELLKSLTSDQLQELVKSLM